MCIRDSGKLENTAYFARYPNNSFYMLILSSYFKCISAFAKDNIYNYLNATIPINCIPVSYTHLVGVESFIMMKKAVRYMERRKLKVPGIISIKKRMGKW